MVKAADNLPADRRIYLLCVRQRPSFERVVQYELLKIICLIGVPGRCSLRLERWLSLAKAEHLVPILKAGYMETSLTGNHWSVSRCFVKGGISISICYALVLRPVFRLISAFFAVFLAASTMGQGWFVLASVACARP